MQLISYLDAPRPGSKNSRKLEVPVAVVFTKADLFEEWISDPESFARGNVSSLHAQCQARLEHCCFYCSGVAGSSARLPSWTTRGKRAWSPCGLTCAGSSSRLRGWSASLARAVFRCIACAAALTPPPTPPLQGGKVGGVWSFSPLAKGGHRGVLRVPLRCARFGIQAIENRFSISRQVEPRFR